MWCRWVHILTVHLSLSCGSHVKWMRWWGVHNKVFCLQNASFGAKAWACGSNSTWILSCPVISETSTEMYIVIVQTLGVNTGLMVWDGCIFILIFLTLSLKYSHTQHFLTDTCFLFISMYFTTYKCKFPIRYIEMTVWNSYLWPLAKEFCSTWIHYSSQDRGISQFLYV